MIVVEKEKKTRKSNPKFKPDVSDMKAIATKLHGNIRAIAQHYKVTRETIYDYLYRTPKGMQILKTCREQTHEDFIDTAEFIFQYNMSNYKEDPALAQRAAEKVIDKKGHTRGWISEKDQPEANQEIKSQFNALMAQVTNLQKQKSFSQSEESNLSIDDSNNSNDA